MANPGIRRPAPIAETTSEVEASLWVDALQDEGIRAAYIQLGPGGAMGGAISFRGLIVYRILVDADHLGDARSIIADLDGARALLPIPGDADGEAIAPRVMLLVSGAVLLLAVIAGGISLLGSLR